MATHVHHGAQGAIGLANHDDRYTREAHRAPVTRLRYVGRHAEENGAAAKQDIEFGLESVRVTVRRGCVDHRRIAVQSLETVARVRDPIEQLDLAFLAHSFNPSVVPIHWLWRAPKQPFKAWALVLRCWLVPSNCDRFERCRVKAQLRSCGSAEALAAST